MQITILGGGGFLGRKLAAHLAQTATLGGRPVTGLTLFDLAEPPRPAGAAVPGAPRSAGDLVDLPPEAIPPGTDVVFHLAAVVSAAAEADYDLGRRVNLRGTDAVVDACRRLTAPGANRRAWCSPARSPASAAARTRCWPTTPARSPANSYGAQKAAAELILADASRRGFLDAVSLRLPTIIVRPGRPNQAASSFLSAIIREPLLGLATELPVPDALRRLGRQPAPRRRLAAARRRRWTPRRWAWTAASTRPASAPPSPSCCRRWRR